jgi:hypothetical protein
MVLKPIYILRLDDACPTMKWDNWLKLEEILDKHQIKPIIGVIPDCKDPKLKLENPRKDFWEWVKGLNKKGWYIAMHGYQHLYETHNSGIIGLNNYSEFAGLPYPIQAKKIKKAWEIFLDKGLKPKIWMAPAHSFDINTLKALKEHTEIEYITDGFAIFPFTQYGFKWIPQQLWKFRKFPFGVWTICLHPNTMTRKDLEVLEKILERYKDLFRWNILELDFGNTILKDMVNNSFRILYSNLLKLKSKRYKK